MANINDLRKMCREHLHCNGCPLYYLDNCMIYRLPDNIDSIVDKWLTERPIKTYAMDFFERYPDAEKNEFGTPTICLRKLYNVAVPKHCISTACNACWNRIMV